jgi:WD40 repeat protein
VYALAWAPDGNYIASASKDQTVHVWEAMTGKLLSTYHGHGAQTWAVSWSPDGKHSLSRLPSLYHSLRSLAVSRR